jgi:hypothetical protein
MAPLELGDHAGPGKLVIGRRGPGNRERERSNDRS